MNAAERGFGQGAGAAGRSATRTIQATPRAREIAALDADAKVLDPGLDVPPGSDVTSLVIVASMP